MLLEKTHSSLSMEFTGSSYQRMLKLELRVAGMEGRE